jgi:hypothetical protein
MNKSIKNIMLIAGLILFAANLYAAGDLTVGTSKGEFIKVGAAGAQFLKMEVGARGNGMAGAFCSTTNDISSVFWNPAGLADVKKIGAEFDYTQWFAGFSHNFAAAALPVGQSFTAAVSLFSFTSDRIPVTTIDKPEGTGSKYTISDVAIAATFSGYLTEQFSFGITGKYIQTAFSSVSSSGMAFDIGTMYQTGIRGIKLGFSIHNLGSQQTYDGVDLSATWKRVQELNANPDEASLNASPFNIPLIFRAGVSTDIYKDDEHSVIGAFDFVTMSDVAEQYSIGAEYTWHDLLSIRAGYKIGQDQMGLAGGLGIKYIGGGFGGRLEYSINPSKDLGLVNRLTVALSLN